jgi:hypothetical protein
MPADPFRHLGEDAEEEAPLLPVGRSLIPVSYTHLTLPTTPYV